MLPPRASRTTEAAGRQQRTTSDAMVNRRNRPHNAVHRGDRGARRFSAARVIGRGPRDRRGMVARARLGVVQGQWGSEPLVSQAAQRVDRGAVDPRIGAGARDQNEGGHCSVWIWTTAAPLWVAYRPGRSK